MSRQGLDCYWDLILLARFTRALVIYLAYSHIAIYFLNELSVLVLTVISVIQIAIIISID